MWAHVLVRIILTQHAEHITLILHSRQTHGERERAWGRTSARTCKGDDERKSWHKTLQQEQQQQQQQRKRYEVDDNSDQKSIDEIRGGKFSHLICKRRIIHYSVCDFSRVSLLSHSLSLTLRSFGKWRESEK